MSKWTRVGLIVGSTSVTSFKFVITELAAKVGDIVATEVTVPTTIEGNTQTVYVWGRVTGIERFNPFFPSEAATELVKSTVDIADTPLSTLRDHLVGEVLILGRTAADISDTLEISPLTYPVKPSGYVYSPPQNVLHRLLVGNNTDEKRLALGNLIGRNDVEVSLSATQVVARHMAILAMTGGGKTVASRQIISETAQHGYPVVIMDPHGDYLGLWEKQKELLKGTKVRLFYPSIWVSEENIDTIASLVEKMGTKLTDAQMPIHHKALYDNEFLSAESAIDFLERVSAKLDNWGKDEEKRKDAGFSERSVWPVRRNIRNVITKLKRMEENNARLRELLNDYDFEPMPDPITSPEKIVAPNQISIFYLSGFDHLAQSTIASIVLENLFEHRASLQNTIPPYLAVIEEAHNFIPSRNEGTSETPSLPTIRRMITEGRKFGTGLLIISQRPSRLDETTLAMCNTFLVLRLVNPKDKSFVRSVMENLSESDANILQSFGRGQGLISGQAVKFPMLVQVNFNPELISDKIGNEDNFFSQVENFSLSTKQSVKQKNDERTKDLPDTKKTKHRRKMSQRSPL
ncbi:ATP-binding protein [Vibrio rhodolitus]|uniref:ATP-binding protein n=1 Tax=Vibrio rhodolitus TaxID=2231649 RepID=UPI000E0B468A|nr:ATP-binding protein [Vibrio rhodolitus]